MGNKVWDVTSVLYDKGIVWISTVGQGILRYHVASGHADRITYQENNKENSLSHTDVFGLSLLKRSLFSCNLEWVYFIITR